jgi:hypothetical protein
MNTLFTIGEWLLVVAFFGTILTTISLVWAAFSLKNCAVRSAKTIYERPWQRIKNIMATGKGIGQQETVRLQQIATHAKVAAESVQETVAEAKVVVEAVKSSDLKPLLSNIQNVMKFAEMFNTVVRSAKS